MNSVHTVLNKPTQKIAQNGRLFAVYAAYPSYPIQNNRTFIATEATTSVSRGFLYYYGHRYRLAEKRYTHV